MRRCLAGAVVAAALAAPVFCQTPVATIGRPGLKPWSLAVYEAGNKLLVGDRATGNLLIYDAGSFQLLAELAIDGGAGGACLEVHEGSGKLYFSTFPSGDHTAVVDLVGNKLLKYIPVDSGCPKKDEALGRIYGVKGSTLVAIDVATDTYQTVPLDTSGLTTGLGVNPVTHELFVPHLQAGKLDIVDGNTLQRTTVQGAPGRDAAVNWLENKVYGTKATFDGFWIFNRNTNTLKTVNVANDAERVLFNPAGNRTYSNSEVNRVATVLDGPSDSFFNFEIGSSDVCGVRRLTNRVYYAGQTFVGVFDDLKRTLTMIPVNNPTPSHGVVQGCAINESTGLVFTTNDGDQLDFIQVIDDKLAAPSISIDDRMIIEGNSGKTPLVFTVALSSASTTTVTVDYATAWVFGRAHPGQDFVEAAGTLTFNPGETSKTVSVEIIGDIFDEPNETFEVVLENPANAALAEKSKGVGTVGNDDVTGDAPRVSFEDRAVREGAALNAAFRVFLSKPAGSTVTVTYQTENGTALAGSDYTARSGTLSFTPGRTQESIYVPITADGLIEPDETFFVNLTSTFGAFVGDAQAVGTISDPPPASKIAMYRSYNKSTDYHFFTTDLSSKNFAVGTLGFQDESNPVPFYVWNVMQSGTVPLFRMYNPNLGRHFYTASSGSRDFIMSIGGVYEKEEGFVYPLSTSPVPSGATELFLLYNNNSGTHLFTADANQKNAILNMFPGVWVQHTSVGYVFTSP